MFKFFSKQLLKANQIIVLQVIIHKQYCCHLIVLVSAHFKRNQETSRALSKKNMHKHRKRNKKTSVKKI